MQNNAPLPTHMRAVIILNPGPESRLQLITVAMPVLKPGEMLIRAAYTALNRADLLQRKGHYPAPEGASPYPGLEVSGHIAALAPSIGGWQVGDAVCALLAGGGYAEYVAVPAGQVMPVPASITLREAASLPEAYATVWQNLVQLGHLKKDEHVLIHGGGSGIGITAIQFAHAFIGARVYATAGTDEKCALCRKLGAEEAVNYKAADFSEALENQIDVVLDMTGGDHIAKNFRVLRKGGRLLSIAFIRGAVAEVNFMPLLQKNLTWSGSTLRARTTHEKAEICAALVRDVWPAFADGRLRAVIDGEFPLAQAEKAHSRMQQNLNLGKILLQVAHSPGI